MAAAIKISRERAERVNKALIATFFTQAMVTMAIIIRIPEIIDNLGLSKNLAIWGTITGLSGIGSMLALIFAHRLVVRFGTTRIVQVGTLAATAIQGMLPLIHNYWLYFVVTFFQAAMCSSPQMPAHQGVMRPSGVTAVASAMIMPAPPTEREM